MQTENCAQRCRRFCWPSRRTRAQLAPPGDEIRTVAWTSALAAATTIAQLTADAATHGVMLRWLREDRSYIPTLLRDVGRVLNIVLRLAALVGSFLR